MIFIDTNFYVSLENKADSNHEKAKEILNSLIQKDPQFFTTTLILYETVTVISLRVGREAAIYFKDNFDPATRVLWLDKAIETKAWNLFRKIKDKDVSFVDCYSFALLGELMVREVLTFDKDFAKQGFQLLGL